MALNRIQHRTSPTLNSHCPHIDSSHCPHIAPYCSVSLDIAPYCPVFPDIARHRHRFIVVVVVWFIVWGIGMGHCVGSLGGAMGARYDVDADLGGQSYVTGE